LLLAHASWLVAKSRSDFALPLCARKGLQRKSFWRSQKIEAESPVCGVLRRKCAQILNYKWVNRILEIPVSFQAPASVLATACAAPV
jgi:hypothetical protein